MPRNDPNKVLRISSDATVSARDYKQVLCDTSGNAIALTIISPQGLSEWSLKIKNTAAVGNDVTVSVAGSFTIDGGSLVIPAGGGVIVEQDDLGQLWVFGSTAGGGTSGWQIPAGQSLIYSSTAYADDGSFQPIGPDLNLDPAAGTSDVGDSSYLATIMGNIFGDTLTKTKTIIAGLIGKFSVVGGKLSTYPWGAVIGEVGDGVEAADGAFVAVLGGDSAQTNARAAFTVDNQNSTPGSGFDYGLDLAGVGTHDGYPAVAYLQADIRFADGTTQSTAGGVMMETPTGAVDGVNDEFVFSAPPIFVTYQGVIQNGGDYTLVGSTVTFTVPPVTGSVQGLIAA